jgi:hypothetical protein
MITLGCFLSSTSLFANEKDYTTIHDSKTNSTIFVFKVERGDVNFDHELHQLNMKSESCIPCHKTTIPTKAATFTRLEERRAHYFCKGCHHSIGKGPTECHECHILKH